MESTFWHPGIIWVAGNLHFGILGHGDDTFQKILDSLPHRIVIAPGKFEHPGIYFGRLVDEATATCAAAARRVPGANDPKICKVVFHRRDTSPSGIADHGADFVDLPVPFRTLSEQDIRVIVFVDRYRRHRQRDHRERQSEGFDVLAKTRQSVG